MSRWIPKFKGAEIKGSKVEKPLFQLNSTYWYAFFKVTHGGREIGELDPQLTLVYSIGNELDQLYSVKLLKSLHSDLTQKDITVKFPYFLILMIDDRYYFIYHAFLVMRIFLPG